MSGNAKMDTEGDGHTKGKVQDFYKLRGKRRRRPLRAGQVKVKAKVEAPKHLPGINLVHNCSITKHPHVSDFANIRHQKNDDGTFKLLPRPSCRSCHGTGTAGFRSVHVDGVWTPIAMACACLFKNKSPAQVRFFEKHERICLMSLGGAA